MATHNDCWQFNYDINTHVLTANGRSENHGQVRDERTWRREGRIAYFGVRTETFGALTGLFAVLLRH